MTVRAFQYADLAEIAELEKCCFSEAWSKEAFESSMRVPFFTGTLIEEDGKIAAYCCLSTVFEDAEVLNIAVAPESRRRGYGKILLEGMLQTAKKRGATQCFLEVRQSNAPAIALYQSFGFVGYGVRKKYYADGEDAIVMKKTL